MESQTFKYPQEVIEAHGFKPSEYEYIIELLGREPSFAEMGIISVMWSEHCSYKHSKNVLKKLPITGSRVVQGPGENAGALDIGDGYSCVFKVESHNHPSAVEPYQGAATGVGGILRDIHTMGARPVANLNSLSFGSELDDLTKFRINGVISGIADYGNCTGIPTVGGEINFDPSYAGNPLVNAMCAGILKSENIALSGAGNPGTKLLYYGSATGRDGIHGATFASVELDDSSDTKRPCVQVADPFMGKKIMEATLDLIGSGVVDAIQDMGAAGLTCSSTEMAEKGGTGLKMDLDKVPQRAANMEGYEILLSESQERMLAAVTDENLDQAFEILGQWDVHGAVIGEIVEGGQVEIDCLGERVVDFPLETVISSCPVYNPEKTRPKYLDQIKDAQTDAEDLVKDLDPIDALKKVLALPQIASKRWIYQQFDHSVQANTVINPGGDAAVIRIRENDSHLALSLDSNPLFCYLDPFEGGKQIIAESARNVAATGALPIGFTNCLNFGNPEKPEIFYQFDNCIEGMSEAGRALDTPVVSGNVSLYNETSGEAILPTPSIGMIGTIESGRKPIPAAVQNEGDVILLIGENAEHLGGSTLLNYALQSEDKFGPVIKLDLEQEKIKIDLLVEAAKAGLINSAHDVSEGGLLTALVECCICGDQTIGAEIELPEINFAQLFGEGSGQFILTCSAESKEKTIAHFENANISTIELGKTSSGGIKFNLINEIDPNEMWEIYYKKPF